MIRYIKAIFGIYDHYFLTPDKFFEKYHHIIESIFDIEAISDEHCGGEYRDNKNAEKIVEEIIARPEEKRRWVYSYGDIVDFVCGYPKNFSWMYSMTARLIIALRFRAKLGNHEGLGTNDDPIFEKYKNQFGHLYWPMVEAFEKGPMFDTLPNGVKLWGDHGDLITEKQRKDYLPYRYKKHGATGVKLAQVYFLDKLDLLKTKRPLPKGFIEEVRKQMDDNGSDVFICGHFHPEGQRYYFDEKTRKLIIILPAHQLNKVRIPKMKAV